MTFLNRLSSLATVHRPVISRSLFHHNHINDSAKGYRGIRTSYALFDSSISSRLMEFFDDKKNWGEIQVKSGRPWKLEELRIKSNQDLHKLWFVLYKERNMLMTMMLAYERDKEPMPGPERLDKVEESMANLQNVIRERNKAYWDLEVGYGTTGERPYIIRRDQFGRYRSHKMSEHVVPYRYNKAWRQLNAPGFGESVKNFMSWYKSKLWGERRYRILKDMHRVRGLVRRFPDVDRTYLQDLYPEVPVQHLNEKHPETGQAKEDVTLVWNKSLTRKIP